MTNFLRYFILISIIWNIPSFCLKYVSDSTGTLLSHLTFISLALYYFLNRKSKSSLPFIILGSTYFLLAGLRYNGEISMYYYYMDFVKFLICILGGTEILRRSKYEEIFYIILLGVLSISFYAIIYPDNYGRYSGFYLDPNNAALICLIGFVMCYGISHPIMKQVGKFIFSISGILTFSRHFMIMWFLILIISMFLNKKNIKDLIISFGVLLILLFSADQLQLNEIRFSWFRSILVENEIKNSEIMEDSRTETWSMYYDKLKSKPLIGHGYNSFKGQKEISAGVHNTFFMVLGEAGILPFTILLGIYIFLIIKGVECLKYDSVLFLLAIVLFSRLLVVHNYFDNYYTLFFSIWLYQQLYETGVFKRFYSIS